jgi:hypothetical protein
MSVSLRGRSFMPTKAVALRTKAEARDRDLSPITHRIDDEQDETQKEQAARSDKPRSRRDVVGSHVVANAVRRPEERTRKAEVVSLDEPHDKTDECGSLDHHRSPGDPAETTYHESSTCSVSPKCRSCLGGESTVAPLLGRTQASVVPGRAPESDLVAIVIAVRRLADAVRVRLALDRLQSP